MRCLKRYVAREVFRFLVPLQRSATHLSNSIY